MNGKAENTTTDNHRLSIDKIRKILWKDFTHLTDSEIIVIREDMINFWLSMVED
jgi:hypothetical protein